MNNIELKNGMSFVTRGGDKFHIMGNTIYIEEGKYSLEFYCYLDDTLNDYDANLKNKHLITQDITKVFDIDNNLIWEKGTVDWSKIPIDTKIWVRDSKDDDWLPRHFAKYENGKVFVYYDGRTSWSNGNESVLGWNYAKLTEESEKESSHITWGYIIREISERCSYVPCDNYLSCNKCQFDYLSKNFDKIVEKYYFGD